jgi:hypothetical protein
VNQSRHRPVGEAVPPGAASPLSASDGDAIEQHSLFVSDSVRGGYGRPTVLSRAQVKEDLRRRVMRELRDVGFRRTKGLVVAKDMTKDGVRALHERQRETILERERPFIRTWEDYLIRWFADGSEVEPDLIFPEVVPVSTEEEAALFKFASLHWSVPVSQGYGRRNRFLVVDGRINKLIGIFALGDPVFNLTARDSVIDWSSDRRKEALYGVFDAFVLGAVDPYRQLLGGKLVAMAAASDATLDFLEKKYAGTTTHIQKREKNPRPVLITTTSALGRSSIYNRLRYEDHKLYESVGFTRGFGHFHISEELFRELMDFLETETGKRPGHRYGQGPNWRMRAIRECFVAIDLNRDLLKHGIKREVFLAPLASNWVDVLRGDSEQPEYFHFDLSQMAAFFARRWAYPRAQRDGSYAEITRDAMRLSPIKK